MRWLVRFGYDGTVFAGWARQPGLRTVEGELRRGLGRHARTASIRLEVASRTDRGVSARANALALDSELSGPALLRQLNGISPEIFCTAAAPIPPEFRVRAAIRRHYRYFLPGEVGSLGLWRSAARLFRGTVDVRSFGRSIPPGAPCWRTVEEVAVAEHRGGLVLEIRAPSFVWGMVRKIVAALQEVDRGRLSLTNLEAALRGERRLNLPLAPPEGLVLWEVEYPMPWTVRWTGPNRRQAAYRSALAQSLWIRSRWSEALDPL
jgi:tRNA pseudouridine38-40 synthase